MSTSPHPTGALHELADGRLAGADRQRVEEHLRECQICRADWEAIAAVKRAVARLPAPSMPSGLEAKVKSALADQPTAADLRVGQADATHEGPTPISAQVRRKRWMLPLGVAAALLVGVVLWWRAVPSLPARVAATVADYNAQRLVVTTTEGDAVRLGAYFAERLDFPVRVFDLGMMGFAIDGGRVHTVGSHRSALWAYRGAAGWLLCQMYTGRTAELPVPSETRNANGFAFLVYHEGGGTQVFWQEGDVVCVLASYLPSEDVVQLAIAKAMKP